MFWKQWSDATWTCSVFWPVSLKDWYKKAYFCGVILLWHLLTHPSRCTLFFLIRSNFPSVSAFQKERLLRFLTCLTVYKWKCLNVKADSPKMESIPQNTHLISEAEVNPCHSSYKRLRTYEHEHPALCHLLAKLESIWARPDGLGCSYSDMKSCS